MDKRDWEEKYRGEELVFGREPARFLAENLHLLPQGKALDLAMGEGRNAIYLARHGWKVTGVDISETAVAKCLKRARQESVPVEAIAADLTTYPIPEGTYDLILNFYYLQRNLIPSIKTGLKPGGMVVFETYIVEQLQYEGGPRDPAFLLAPNELLDHFRDFRVILYRELVVDSERDPGKKAIASLIARKPEKQGLGIRG